MTAKTVIDEARQPEHKVLGHGFSLMAEQIRMAPKEFALGFAFTTVHSLATIAFSYGVGWTTDRVLIPAARSGNVTRTSIVTTILILLIIGGFKAMGLSLRRYAAYHAQYRLEKRDRVDGMLTTRGTKMTSSSLRS